MAISKHYSEQYQWWYFYDDESGQTWWMEQPPEPEGPPVRTVTEEQKLDKPSAPPPQWYWFFPLPLLGLRYAIAAVKTGSLNPFYERDEGGVLEEVTGMLAHVVLWTLALVFANAIWNPFPRAAEVTLILSPGALLVSFGWWLLPAWMLRHLSQNTFKPRYEFKLNVFLGGIVGFVVSWAYANYAPAIAVALVMNA